MLVVIIGFVIALKGKIKKCDLKKEKKESLIPQS